MEGTIRDPLGPAWETIRRWPGLRGEPKLAWRYAWVLARGRPGEVNLSFAGVGDDQGTSSDAGRRHLKTLVDYHLLRVITKSPGHWLVEVLDPREVCRLRGWTDNGQQTIDFDRAASNSPADASVDGEEHAEVGPLPRATLAADAVVVVQPRGDWEENAEVGPHPRSAQTSENLGKAQRASKTLTSVTLETSVTSEFQGYARQTAAVVLVQPRRRSGASAEESATDPRPLAASLTSSIIERQPGDAECLARAERIENLATWLMERVRLLRSTPALRVASAVIDGRLPLPQVHKICAKIDQLERSGELHSPPFAYFVDSCRAQFAQRGIHWPNPKETR
jgi:hypothetical protein